MNGLIKKKKKKKKLKIFLFACYLVKIKFIISEHTSFMKKKKKNVRLLVIDDVSVICVGVIVIYCIKKKILFN